jgi:hypothetical protein
MQFEYIFENLSRKLNRTRIKANVHEDQHTFFMISRSFLLLLPLALQPAVGFGLSNNILPFFSYLSPTLSIIVKSTQLFAFFDFRKNKFFTVWGC